LGDDAGVAGDDDSMTVVMSKCGFEFRASDDLVETQVGGDSCLNRYEANGCDYLGDYGRYSAPLDNVADEPSFQSELVMIDGLEARAVSYGADDGMPRPWFAGVHFPAVPKGVGQKFTFMARCENAEAQREAIALFQTLRFER
jgi:hypothetical protein